MANFIDKLTTEELQNIVSESISVSEILRKLGKADRGGNHTLLVKHLKEHPEINTETLVGRRIQRVSKKGIPLKKLSEVLVENSTGNSHKLKLRLIKEGVKEEKCEVCNNTEWMGGPIPLDLHHINGNHFDNRLENLIILCPNCHRLTDNHRNKNASIDLIFKQIAEQTAEDKMKLLLEREEKRLQEILENKYKHNHRYIRLTPVKEKVKKYCLHCGKEITGKGEKYCSLECANIANAKIYPSKEELLEMSKQFKSMEEMGRHYNISGNGLKKWFNKYNIYNEIKSNFKQKTYPIIQFDLDGNFIKEWKDGNEIERVLGYNKSKIQLVCNGNQKTSYNFTWKYKKDVKLFG